MPSTVWVLFLADTHLGFDLPLRPRVERRRRGEDFFRNYRRALQPAFRGQVDLVVHGGDVLFRSKVRSGLVQRAFAPLLELADRLPVVVVPGNHERSQIPFPLLAVHPNLHLFNAPRTVSLPIAGTSVAVSGFPFVRRDVRGRFPELLCRCERPPRSDIGLLVLHQAIEGARVSPGFTFRHAHDVVQGRDLPRDVAAVLAGHIHRHQVLTHDLARRPLPAPVLYPGSIERTSFVERREAKGFLTLELEADGCPGGRLANWRFHPLPARPMVELVLDAAGLDGEALERHLVARLHQIDSQAVVRIRPSTPLPERAAAVLAAERLRQLAPPSMTVTVAWPRPVAARS